jgi:hypothetical protein
LDYEEWNEKEVCESCYDELRADSIEPDYERESFFDMRVREYQQFKR